MPREKWLLQVVGFGSTQSGKTLESSGEKGPAVEGSIQGLLMDSQDGVLFGGSQSGRLGVEGLDLK